MNIEPVYMLPLAVMMLLQLRALPNGPANALFMILIAMLFVVGSLLVYSGVSVWWALGTFIAACTILAIGIGRADAERSIESRWTLVCLLSIPIWAIVGFITGLVRLLSYV